MFPTDETLAAFGLFLVRSSALVVAVPLVSKIGFAMYKIALVIVLAGVMYSVCDTPTVEFGGFLDWGLLAIREFLIGFGLAMLLQVSLLAARVGGELVGLEMGIQMGAQVDPISGVSTPLIARYYEEVLIVGLFAINGHHWIVRGLRESFERAPVGSANFNLSIVELITTFFREMFSAGLAFVAPIIVLMSLVSLVVGLIARTVPQINVLELSFTLRIAVALIGLVLFAPGLEVLVTVVMDQLDQYTAAFLDLLEA